MLPYHDNPPSEEDQTAQLLACLTVTELVLLGYYPLQAIAMIKPTLRVPAVMSTAWDVYLTLTGRMN